MARKSSAKRKYKDQVQERIQFERVQNWLKRIRIRFKQRHHHSLTESENRRIEKILSDSILESWTIIAMAAGLIPMRDYNLQTSQRAFNELNHIIRAAVNRKRPVRRDRKVIIRSASQMSDVEVPEAKK